MMILRSSPASPFSRFVRIAADLAGVSDRIEVVGTAVTAPADANALKAVNPLGKIPTLVTEDGEALYDSRVIVEYLDGLSGGRLIPRDAGRFATLRLQALALGIMDAALLQIYEGRYRPAEMRHEPWVAMQAEKVETALKTLEAAPPALSSPPDAGQIALACALGYLDLRFGGRWRDAHPRLVGWLDRFAAAVPAFGASHIDP